jgi:hypothetical protein
LIDRKDIEELVRQALTDLAPARKSHAPASQRPGSSGT